MSLIIKGELCLKCVASGRWKEWRMVLEKFSEWEEIIEIGELGP